MLERNPPSGVSAFKEGSACTVVAQPDYGIAALVLLMVVGLTLIAAACFAGCTTLKTTAPAAWAQYRFGYVVYALIFLSFDMEMVFMYPWGVVFADIGVAAFLDMIVFIALLSAGIAYAWGMGGLEWE